MLFTTLIGALTPWQLRRTLSFGEDAAAVVFTAVRVRAGIIFGTVFWDRGHNTYAPQRRPACLPSYTACRAAALPGSFMACTLSCGPVLPCRSTRQDVFNIAGAMYAAVLFLGCAKRATRSAPCALYK